jgi:hypothetical protein
LYKTHPARLRAHRSDSIVSWHDICSDTPGDGHERRLDRTNRRPGRHAGRERARERAVAEGAAPGEAPLVVRAVISAVLCLLCSTAGIAQAVTFIGPLPYRGIADSPFGDDGVVMFLETFEDGMLNGPGVVATSGGSVPPGAILRDSVDEDDGAIDGSGSLGRSFYSSAGETGTSALTFTFDPRILGRFPTRAGIVWTDVGQTTSTFGVGGLVFEAFDAAGASLGTIGPTVVGDGAVSGETAEDRFFGVAASQGISAIALRMTGSTDWEVDHLQYEIGDFAESQSELAQCQASLATTAGDADQDGRRDADDVCPQTPEGTAVDERGCSVEQFCGAIDATGRRGRRTCLRADWLNDEPLMKRSDADCRVARSRESGGVPRCVAR